MATQIRRVSPHQTAKVFAVLMAVASIPFLILAALIAPLVPGSNAGAGVGIPWSLVIVLPLCYLVFGYIFTAIGCWFYNVMYRVVGGVEIEFTQT